MRISKIRLQELINEVVEETTNQGRALQEQKVDFTFLISSLEDVVAALEEAKDDAAKVAPDISGYIEDTWTDFDGHLEDIRTRASAAAEAEKATPETAVAPTTGTPLEESEYLEEIFPLPTPKRNDGKKKPKKKKKKEKGKNKVLKKKKKEKGKNKVLYGEGDELEEEIELNEEELEEMILDEFDALRE